MGLNALVTGLARKRSGLALLVGVSTMLTGIERILTTKPRRARPAIPVAEKAVRESYFCIRQTKSELGYMYWVLQGFGCYKSFSLHDSWPEAMDEANRRVANRKITVPQAVPEYDYA